MKGSQGTKRQIKKEASIMDEKQQEKLDKALGDLGNKMLKQGILPKDAMGVSNSYLENVYSQAYRLYNTGKYAEAIHLFRILILLNAMESKYMLGLAACFHMMKEYNNAIQTYTMCSALDPGNPIPHYHTSDCFIQMKDYLSAMLCLELTIDRAKDQAEYAKMKERAQMSLNSLQQQLNSTPEGAEKPLTGERFDPSQMDFF